MVITTAVAELSDDQRDAFPDSGRLFAAHVTVPGLPTISWSGLTRPFPTTDLKTD
jgi:hypothetical protein